MIHDGIAFTHESVRERSRMREQNGKTGDHHAAFVSLAALLRKRLQFCSNILDARLVHLPPSGASNSGFYRAECSVARLML